MKLDALDHPKTNHFASLLGISRPTAIGHLELLWAFTGKMSPQGNIGKWPDGAIARACDWMGDPKAFLEALLEARLLDQNDTHRLLVHDWHVHAAGWVRAKLKNANQRFLTGVSTSEAAEDVAKEPTRGATREATIQGKGNEGKGNEELELVPPGGTNGHSVESPTDSVHRVFEHWKLTWDHPRAQLDDKRRKLIRDQLKTYSETDLITSISGYKNSPHHTGKNERKTVYDAIELFLRDAQHIDAGLAHAKQQPQHNWG